MRILYLALDIRLSEVTGDAIHVREATAALAALGAEVHLVAPALDGEDRVVLDLTAKGVHVHAITAKGNLQTALVCRKLAKESRAEVIYERRASPKIAAAVSQATGLPFLIEVNGLIDQEVAALGKKRTPSGALKSRLRKALFRRAAQVVAVTPGIAKALQDQYDLSADRVTVVPNGADIERFRPKEPASAKKALELPATRPVVGFVGTLYPWQGVEHLVAAAPEILTRAPDVRFLIVGDGSERERLQSAVKKAGLADRFQFTGRVPYESVPGYVNASDVCVLLKDPDLYGAFTGYSPLKLYEYLACGRPIVATRTSGFEVLEEVDCGVLVNPRDPTEVSVAVVSLLHDAARREAMGRRARAIAVERYSWKAVAERYLTLMQKAAA